MGEQGVVRTNISVPRDLKARMDAAGERVNWSAVAAEAFEAKLLELESRKGVDSMEDVIARMKAADELDNKEDYQAGRKVGEAWARGVARPKQLRALAKLEEVSPHNMAGSDIPGWLNLWANDYNKGIAHCLFEAIHPNGPVFGSDGDTFWEEVEAVNWEDVRKPVNNIENFDFALGFIEGALDVWEKVQGKL